MKPVLLDNIFSEKELFFIYKQIMSAPNWQVVGKTSDVEYPSNKQFSDAPVFRVKDDDSVNHYPLYIYVQSLVFRMAEMLNKKNIGMHTNMKRSWFNLTYQASTNHWMHYDSTSPTAQTVLAFITPVWQDAWRGSFYVDGEEFKFKPGSAVIFNSNEFHSGETPESQSQNWSRLTLNIVLDQ
tara:strand:- start:1201 stop:1746 length:546 start_codon:yes stop_codon:yes gene_type:complete